MVSKANTPGHPASRPLDFIRFARSVVFQRAKMTRWFSLCAMAALAIAQGCGESAHGRDRSHESAPISSLRAPERIDLGEVIPGEVAPYKIILRNTSRDKPIILTHVASSCSCTTTSPTPVVVPAGGEAGILGGLTIREDEIRGEVGSAVYLGVGSTQLVEVDLSATIASPLPSQVTRVSVRSGPIVMPLNALYRGRIRSVTAYAGVSDTPLKGGLMDDGGAVKVDAPTDADSIEVVLLMERTNGSVFKIEQTVDLTRVDDVVGAADGAHGWDDESNIGEQQRT